MESKKISINIPNYSGPLEILLDLAKSQKVNLAEISITKLADQFLEFIKSSQDLDLESASEYLLMATWLAYLKSKLLLPDDEDDDSDDDLWDNTLQDGLEEDTWEDRIEEPIEDIEIESEQVLPDEARGVEPPEETFDEDDINKDGIVDEEEKRIAYENGGWKNAYNGKSFYLHPWFDWNRKERWINNRNAINYWLANKGGTHSRLEELKEDYPKDFTTKTY